MAEPAVRRDLALAAEAALWLTLAGLALRVLRFSQVAALAGRPPARPRAARPGEADRIAWAVDAATARAPWRALCFERGLAAFFMLRLRGANPTLCYGARNDAAQGPSAHVWVRLEDAAVVGCDVADRFALLATFPPGDPRRA